MVLLVSDFLLGTYEIPSSRVIFIFFPTLLEDIPLNLRTNLWFMHDGFPVHFERNVRNYLNNQFLQRWIGRGSDHIWPPRSPDLNPLDFFIWDHMKSNVYQYSSHTREELSRKIREEGSNIRKIIIDIFFVLEQILQNGVKNGGHFENLL